MGNFNSGVVIVNSKHDHGSRLLAQMEGARVLEDSSVCVRV